MDFYRVDKVNQYRPKIDMGKFLSTEPLLALENYMSYLFSYIEMKDEEKEKIPHLSHAQRQVYCYYVVEGQVSNGGFVQAIYNGYLKYFPLAIDALRAIGQDDCADLLDKAQLIGNRKEKTFSVARILGLFNSNLYDQNRFLEKLDHQFYDHMNRNNLLFRKRIWSNKTDFYSVDSIPTADSNQVISTTYPDGQPYQSYNLCDQGLDGKYKEYFNDGSLKLEKVYRAGEFTGSSREYFEDGNLRTSCEPEGEKMLKTDFIAGGIKEKSQVVDRISMKAAGKFTYWFTNGKVKIEGQRKDSRMYGLYNKYYENGQLMMTGQNKEGDFYLQNFFLENGHQTLKDGTGYTEEIKHKGGDTQMTKTDYKDGRRHGKAELYVNGVLKSTIMYQNGRSV